jgi:hypothetical protein
MVSVIRRTRKLQTVRPQFPQASEAPAAPLTNHLAEGKSTPTNPSNPLFTNLQLLAIRAGPGAAVLPEDVTLIHMDFGVKTANGHRGAKYTPPPQSLSLLPLSRP